MYEVSAENFSELVLEPSAQLPVLVDFWASWCAPCQMLMPILTNLEAYFKGKFILELNIWVINLHLKF